MNGVFYCKTEQSCYKFTIKDGVITNTSFAYNSSGDYAIGDKEENHILTEEEIEGIKRNQVEKSEFEDMYDEVKKRVEQYKRRIAKSEM